MPRFPFVVQWILVKLYMRKKYSLNPRLSLSSNFTRMYNEHPELAIYSSESFRKGIHLRYESWVTVLLPLERSHRSFASFKSARLLYHSFPFFVIPSLWFLPLDSALFIRDGIHPVPLHTARDHFHQFKGAHRRYVRYNYGRFHLELHVKRLK